MEASTESFSVSRILEEVVTYLKSTELCWLHASGGPAQGWLWLWPEPWEAFDTWSGQEGGRAVGSVVQHRPQGVGAALRAAVGARPGPPAPGRSPRSAPRAGPCSPWISPWPFSPPGELGLISPLKADTAPRGPHERPQPLSANQRQAGPGGGGAGEGEEGMRGCFLPRAQRWGQNLPGRASLTHRGSRGALGDLGARAEGWMVRGDGARPAQEGRAPAIPRWEWGWHRPQPLPVVPSGSRGGQ